MGNLLDMYIEIIGNNDYPSIQFIIIGFYILHECAIIIQNLRKIEFPFPKKVEKILELISKNNDEDENKKDL